MGCQTVRKTGEKRRKKEEQKKGGRHEGGESEVRNDRAKASFSAIGARLYRFYRKMREPKKSSRKTLPLLGSEPRHL